MENQNFTNQSDNIDKNLWKIAKKRAEFKKHFFIYLLINLLLWGIWIFTSLKRGDFSFPWPIFVSFGWGVGIAFNYISVYTNYNKSLTEKEYQKLINKN
jgi:hypothetical protein